MKVIKDFKEYLDIIDSLSLKLSKEQRKELENILTVMLTLLVAFKRDSNLGEVVFSWMDELKWTRTKK